jgi:Uma2 family endonuclease
MTVSNTFVNLQVGVSAMATAPVQTHFRPEDLLEMEAGHRFELINGQLVEKNMGAKSSLVGLNATTLLKNHARPSNLGLVFPADCGYQAFTDDPDRVRFPDGSFIARGRLPDDRAPKGHIRIAPDLMIEVVSPNDAAWEIDQRVDDFLRAGTRLVWVIYPDTRKVLVHRQGGSSARLGANDQLSGEDVLPGFTCSVADLFVGI